MSWRERYGPSRRDLRGEHFIEQRWPGGWRGVHKDETARRYGVGAVLSGTSEVPVRYAVVTRKGRSEHDTFEEAAEEYRIKMGFAA